MFAATVARFSETDSARVYAVVDRWREECLVRDGSLLFEGEQLWTPVIIGELYHRYNENLLEDDRTFEEKFKEQLGGDRKDVTRLAAEVLLVYFLFAVRAVNGPRKRELIHEVLSWGGDQLDDTAEVARALDAGIGNPGQGYNNFRWAHIMYFVAFARRFKELDTDRRGELLGEPWKFKEWLVEADEREQMGRHLLLHLLFPDYFERIASTEHKNLIRSAYQGLLDEPHEDIDRALFQIRERIEELLPNGLPGHAEGIDFYWSPLHEGWALEDPGQDPDVSLTRLGALEFKRQVVLYGPPGTGKTYEAKELARRLLSHQALVRWGPVAFLQSQDLIDRTTDRQIRRLQLHQAWSYEQFIGGLKLNENGGTEVEDGYLLQLIDEMQTIEGEVDGLAPLPWVLILDELNRTDVSRLLGEAFSAMDDRGHAVDLAWSGDGEERTLVFPPDLYVIGTMNLIDQSVEQLDFALRRRFLWLFSEFRKEAIVPVVEELWANQAASTHHPFERLLTDVELLADRADALNRRIAASPLLGEQYKVGHTYFFDITGFISGWPKVQLKGYRPTRYLWSADHKPLPPAVDFWRYSLRPLLDEYLAGIEADARDSEVRQLRDAFLYGKT